MPASSSRTTPKQIPPPPPRQVRPRLPSRGRGVARYAALVDATEALLTQRSADDIGLYQIAERAKVPPASVYHFFPTKEAAFLALAQRYLEGFSSLTRRPLGKDALSGWQSLLAFDLRQAMDYFTLHPPALKLLLGGYGGEETARANREYNERSAREALERFNAAFHLPFLRNVETKFHIMLQIIDAVLTISYLKHGAITEEFYQEALHASVAYCRLFLPERLELREVHRAALARGDQVVLVPQGSADSDDKPEAVVKAGVSSRNRKSSLKK